MGYPMGIWLVPKEGRGIMQILIGSYMKFSDMKFSVIRKNTLDLSGQFMSELPRNEDTKPVSLEDAFKNRPAVKLTISEEGLESWRATVAERKQQAEKADQKEDERVWINTRTSYYTDYSYLFYRKRTISPYGDSDQNLTLNDVAEDLVHAYGKLYDEIVQGYKSGQREVYLMDPGAKDGLRRLTLEEELAYLDEVYKGQVGGLVMDHEYLQKAWKMNLKDLRLEHATGAEREQLLREKEERDYIIKKMAIENTLPEDTREKLLSAAQEFVARYLNGNGESISQIVANVQALSEFRR